MQIELNIGLDIAGSANFQSLRDSRAQFALDVLSTTAVTQNILGSRRAQSGTEDTLIVKLNVSSGAENRFRKAIFDLADDLDQDCIAAYNATGWSGELVGPNAAAWGEFNPEFFIRFDESAPAAKIFTKKVEPKVAYTGHGAKTGGLQGHSVGSDYPYMVVGVQDRAEAPTEWRVMDTRTSKMSDKFPTQQRAIIEMSSLRIRNCMHS